MTYACSSVNVAAAVAGCLVGFILPYVFIYLVISYFEKRRESKELDKVRAELAHVLRVAEERAFARSIAALMRSEFTTVQQISSEGNPVYRLVVDFEMPAGEAKNLVDLEAVDNVVDLEAVIESDGPKESDTAMDKARTRVPSPKPVAQSGPAPPPPNNTPMYSPIINALGLGRSRQYTRLAKTEQADDETPCKGPDPSDIEALGHVAPLDHEWFESMRRGFSTGDGHDETKTH